LFLAEGAEIAEREGIGSPRRHREEGLEDWNDGRMGMVGEEKD